MPTHYIAETSTGQIVSRKSTNPFFTHAAMQTDDRGRHLPNFSTSREKAHALFVNGWGRNVVPPFEVVALRKVDAAEYRKATKGIDPRTGRPTA